MLRPLPLTHRVWYTPWNNEHVRLFGLRFSIFSNYLGGVRISNFFFWQIYLGGSNFGVRFLLLANYFSCVRISNFIFVRYLRTNDGPFCGRCPAGGLDFAKSRFPFLSMLPPRAASILKNRIFWINVCLPSIKTALFSWIWASGVC